MEASGSGYPAALTLSAPLQVARWRPLVAWFLAIPHFVVAYVLQILGEVIGVISWFAILFTGKLPESIAGVQCMCLRYSARTQLYAAYLLEPYPPFTFSTTGADPGDLEGLRIDYQPQLEDRNRLTVFFRLLLVIPHLVVFIFLGLAAFVVLVIGFFAVLITGAWPEGLRTFLVNVLRWSTRMMAYMYLLTDEYPPFTLD
jgi:hypothetical protein